VVARQGVDGVRVVFVGSVELVLVLSCVPGGVYDIAADNHEGRVSADLEKRWHDCELGGVSLPGVPDYEEGKLLEVRVFIDDEIRLKLPCLVLDIHPAAPLIVGRVPEKASEYLVPGSPERQDAKPRELPLGGYKTPEFARFPTGPAGPG
jgi:hypothetical protein